MQSTKYIQGVKQHFLGSNQKPNKDANKFYNLLREADHELYPRCKKFTKLSFIIRLFHMKCLNGWSNKSFTMLLELLKETFPEGETLPSSYYEAKKNTPWPWSSLY